MHIDRFLQYLEFEKRYSSHTLTAYKKDLQQFYDYISLVYQTSKINEVDHQIIRSWIVSLINEGISSRSVNRKISTLKSFYKFLQREKQIDSNPLIKILPPKTNKKLPEFVDKENMNLLFDEVIFENNFEGKRNKLIIELLYMTGIRLAELVEIKDSDIDLSNLKLKVLGKRNKERIIPFSNELQRSMSEYLETRNKVVEYPEPNNHFFVLHKGKKIYKKLVYRIVNLYLSKVSTLSKKSPHVLRHTFATHMLNNGADLNAIKEILGHSSLAATQVYTHNTIEKLKEIYNQSHPRA